MILCAPRPVRLASLAVVVAAAAGCRDLTVPGVCTTPFTDTGTVRVFVVGHHFTMEDAASYDSYERSFRRHMARIGPCLSRERPNLIALPEESGLLAWFIGQRALFARGASDTDTAFNAIYAGYYRVADAYHRRFPEVSAARALGLALSDPAWRAMDRTFGGIARDFGVWVLASGNGADVRKTFDPEEVALFGDPEVAASEGAWVATSPEVFNHAVLYDPEGTRWPTVKKVFLTHMEESLDLSAGPLAGPLSFETPFGRIGVAISRDAFYPPLLSRLEDEDAELVVQPEAWSGWTYYVADDAWMPDVILASGWVHTQKYRSFRHNLTPMYVGNLFDEAFDGQVWITEKARPDATERGFAGSVPLKGFLDIGPWHLADPVEGQPSLTLAERREILREYGRSLAPGSGSPLENRYQDSLLARDLWLRGPSAEPQPPVAVTPGGGLVTTAALAPSPLDQTMPDAAFDAAGTPYAAWASGAAGSRRIFVAARGGGGTWSTPVEVAPSAAADQLRPAIAAGPRDVVAVVWQEEAAGAAVVKLAVSTDGAASFGAAVEVDASSTANQWAPDVAFHPAGGELAVAWMDFRTGPEPRIRAARSADLSTFAASVEVAPAEPDPGSLLLDSQAQPSIAWAAQGLAVAWIDYREEDWQVWSALAPGGTFAPAEKVSPPRASGGEILASDPQLSVGPAGELVVTWDEQREHRGHHDVRVAERASAAWSVLPAFPGGAESGATTSRFRPTAASIGGRLWVAWQDLGAGKNALFAARPPDAPVRLDDTGSAGNQLTRARLAASRDGAAGLLLFEDDRDGRSQIYAAALP